MSTSLQEAVSDHSGHEGAGAVDEHAGHDHSQGTTGDAEVEESGMGMRAVDDTDAEQKIKEN